MRNKFDIAAIMLFIPALAAATPAAAGPVARAPAGSVNLYRDINGAPHLYADREADAYWGLGYAMAEDRLSGILLFYLALRGDLAATFGAGPLGDKSGVVGADSGVVDDTVAFDKQMRQMRHLADARTNFATLPRAVRADMTAYIAGIKRYMADHPEKVPVWAPPLEAALPLAAGSFLNLGAVGSDIGVCNAVLAKAGVTALASSIGRATGMSGSNIWALAPNRTADKATVFESDSHSPIALFGSFFYGARINSPTMNAWLLDMTGMPMGLKGHNAHFAWGWSEGPRRPSDCVAVHTEAGAPLRYRVDGKRRRMVSIPYRIMVKGAPAITGRFDYVWHNGVLSPIAGRVGQTAYAVSSTYMGRAGRAHVAYRGLLTARRWADIDVAVARQELYPANLIIAGADGSIRYIRPGRNPARATVPPIGQPVDGNRGTSAWQGIRPIGAAVQLRDPSEGYLTNENVSPDMMFAAQHLRPGDYPADFGFDPGQTDTRQRRAIELLGGDRVIDWRDTLDIVFDDKVFGSERWNHELDQAVREAAEPSQPDAARFIAALIAFDGHFSPESSAALYVAQWRDEVREADPKVALAIERALATDTPLDAAQRAVLLTAARRAAARQAAGLSGFNRRFGDVYRVGRSAPGAPTRGMTLLALPGDREEVTEFGSLWSSIYGPADAAGRHYSYSGSRMPFLVQFTRPIRSYSLPVWGISDNPDSPHYSDGSPLVAKGEMRSNYFEPAQLAGAIRSVRTLRTGVR
ncbi:penicillin acylase family protein [Sphingomonas sp. 28-63-12]|uniref:penicillin acylase family protein n=1 Tax=Sphingomonas sp. 28-63-12 TaxID=1970434 RepID=UPI000BCED13B|nr:MAG: hypothetical protein B7Y47_11230 [Sphingomonas sp. 28-63-12]